MSPPLMVMLLLEWMASSAASIVMVPPLTDRCTPAFRPLALSVAVLALPPPLVTSDVAAADVQHRLGLDAVRAGCDGKQAAFNGDIAFFRIFVVVGLQPVAACR